MNQKEIKTFIHDFHTAIRRLSLGLLLLILIPAPLAPLTACRPYPTPIIPLLGIGWMGLCALLAVLHLVFGILGVRTFRKAARSALTLSLEGGQWLLDWKTRCAKRCIVAAILGLFLLLPWMLCLMTGSDLHRAGSPYIMVCYAGAFLFFGSAAGIVFGAVLRLLLLRRIRFVTSDGIAEEDLPAKKPHWGRFACIAGLATVLAVFLMFRGTWYIQPYIATIPAVEHRQIPITYDETTGVYTLQNPEEGDFRILQLTDIHLGGSLLSCRKDIRALQTVYDLIDRTRPDLIVVTGDFVFPLEIQSFSFNNYTPMMQFCSFILQSADGGLHLLCHPHTASADPAGGTLSDRRLRRGLSGVSASGIPLSGAARRQPQPGRGTRRKSRSRRPVTEIPLLPKAGKGAMLHRNRCQ